MSLERALAADDYPPLYVSISFGDLMSLEPASPRTGEGAR